MIYIGLPVRNEQHTAGVLLWRIRKLLSEENREFHVIVVDDASTDGTREVLEPYSGVVPLTLLVNRDRHGYGACLERIVGEALGRTDYPRRDGLITLQADFTESPDLIPDMLRRFDSGADLVSGRTTSVVGAPRSVRLARRAAGMILRGLSLPESSGDPLSGFRLYRLFLLERASEAMGEEDGRLIGRDGWAANLELLLRVVPHVRRFEETEFELDYGRRYRPSRFRPLPELWGLWRTLREAPRRAVEKGDGERREAS